ncbi:hypothetical protein LCGC14_1265700 [marine sediment metagenome]|uniref:Uncharacterized protein n=1 Tax=marine sediment metagenome TaxID=412755 RepID=A0A0F9LKP7_9ZZZZ
MSEDYIARKIENCKKLIETASSPEQKKIYQGYLEIWQKAVKVGPVGENIHAAAFERIHTPKKAYYIRDGNTNQTRAFKEYLKRQEVE